MAARGPSTARRSARPQTRSGTALGQAQSGVLPVDRRLTTAAYLEDWLEHDAKPRIRPNTYRLDRWLTDQHIAPHIGRVPLA